MPLALERKLKAEARRKGLTGRHAAAYVYGTMRKTGWTPEVTHKVKWKRLKKGKKKRG